MTKTIVSGRLFAAALLAASAAAGCSEKREKQASIPPPPVLRITSVSPTQGTTAGGTLVTIAGTNFKTSNTAVAFGGTAGTSVTVLSATQLTVVTPAHAAGPADVVLTNTGPAETAAETAGFTFVSGPAPAPTVSGVVPSAGPTAGGTTITITGTGYQTGATLTIGGAAATNVAVVSGGRITATTPAGSAGPANVVVTNPDTQTGTLANGFTYQSGTGPNPAPTVSTVSPSSGLTAGGQVVTITGTNFYSGGGIVPTVTFGGTAGTSVTVLSAAAIRVTTPAHAAGTVNVVVSNPDGQSATLISGYTYLLPPPTITTTVPPSGTTAGGTVITIYGASFQTGATVTVGGAAATSVSVNGAGTQITCTTPAGTAGARNVVVTNPDTQSATQTGGFTYVTAGTNPTITSLSPSFGNPAGGTTVTITGSNFSTAGTTTVFFGSTQATTVTVISATTIVVVAPAGALGTAVNVAVVNPSGLSTTSVGAFAYVVAPTVTAISPTLGSAGGGTAVTITGSGFQPGATVTIGGAAATGVTVVSSTTITASSPAGTGGPVAVVVTNADGQSGTLANGFSFLTVTSVSPTNGPASGGRIVTVTGSGFLSGATVAFGGSSATVNSLSSTQIVVLTPAHTPGAVTVVVTNPGGQTASGSYTFNPPPTVSSVSPTSGPTAGGTLVTLTGSNFLSGATVTFGGATATSVTVVSSTTITCVTPARPAGTSTIVVTNADGQTSTLSGAYTYVPPPAPTTVTPNVGPTAGGTTVTIAGTAFVSGATVAFGGTAATVVTISSIQIVVTTPAHAAGAVSVVVTNPDGQSGTVSGTFTYVPPPSISAIAPTNGPSSGGNSVTITGNGFLAGATVTFGGTSGTVTGLTATQIVVTAPAHAAGTFSVVVTNTDGQSASTSYTFNPPPSVTSIAPNSGPTAGNTLVTITGSNFILGATVTIGGAAATSVTFVSSTSITCRTPARPAGAASVTVTNPDGQTGTLAGGFTYVPPPTVTSVSPNAGPTGGGTLVTITGTAFVSGATVTIGGAAATSVTFVSSTQLTAVTPAGTLGPRNVVVTNPDGQSGTFSNGFTYSTTPTVTAIAPTSGSANGGQLVTITGTNFVAGATADLGGSALTGVTVVSATQITGTTSAHAVGTVNVTVTNPGGFTGSLAGAYNYLNATNAQTAAYVFDTSAGIDAKRRWYVNMNIPAFYKDLQNRGLQTWGTPGDTTAPPSPLPLTDQYALDWVRAYVLRTLNIAYGRNGDGTKISGTSINITFVGLAPATGARCNSSPFFYCTNNTTDWGQIDFGGCDPNGNGGPHPSSSQASCNSATVGRASYDNVNSQPCNTYFEYNANSVYHGCGTCPGTRGIFASNLGNAWGVTLAGGRLLTSDQQYLDGTTNSGVRYTQIHNHMQQYARRLAFVCSHEIGHSLGLVATATTGNCSQSGGLCNSPCTPSPSHNDLCTTNIMRSILNLGGTYTDFTQGFSGNPAGPSSAASCWTGGVSSWAILIGYVGLSP